MHYCFFIIRKRAEYFNIERVRKAHDAEIRFILIVTEQNQGLIDTDFKKNMHDVHVVKEINFETCSEIIKDRTGLKDLNGKASIVCTDEPLLITAARLREYFNIKGARPCQYVPFLKKSTMKQILSAKNVKVPKFMDFDGINTAKALPEYHDHINSILGSPYVVKPLASGGSTHVAKIGDHKELGTWYAKHFAAETEYEVNEYVPGDMYHCDSFIVDGEVKASAVYKYFYPCLDFLSGLPLGSVPLDKGSKLYNEILKFNHQVVDILRPPNGATHLEVIVNDNSEIVFIEIGARPVGGSATLINEKNYKINWYELTLRSELGLDLDFTVKEDLYHSVVYLSTYPGIVRSLNVPALKGRSEIKWFIKAGDKIDKFPSSIVEGASAVISFYNSNYSELLSDFELLKHHKPY